VGRQGSCWCCCSSHEPVALVRILSPSSAPQPFPWSLKKNPEGVRLSHHRGPLKASVPLLAVRAVQNSEFLRFMSKMGRGEVVVEDGALKPGMGAAADGRAAWAEEFDGLHRHQHHTAPRPDWADEFLNVSGTGPVPGSAGSIHGDTVRASLVQGTQSTESISLRRGRLHLRCRKAHWKC